MTMRQFMWIGLLALALLGKEREQNGLLFGRLACGVLAMLEELERTRARGYGLEDEERELGARTVSAPVRDFTGQIAAGLRMSAPIARMSARRMEELIPLLLETAGRLSRILACDTP